MSLDFCVWNKYHVHWGKRNSTPIWGIWLLSSLLLLFYFSSFKHIWFWHEFTLAMVWFCPRAYLQKISFFFFVFRIVFTWVWGTEGFVLKEKICYWKVWLQRLNILPESLGRVWGLLAYCFKSWCAWLKVWIAGHCSWIREFPQRPSTFPFPLLTVCPHHYHCANTGAQLGGLN